MRRWITEDWRFTITVVKGEASCCRLGLETGDEFRCEYAVPEGFCPKTMQTLHTLCEIVRCGGDLRLRGSADPLEIDFPCADGQVQFHLRAERIVP